MNYGNAKPQLNAAPKFTFRMDGAPTPAHETLRVFINGASAGLLTLRTDEAVAFKRALSAEAAAPELADAAAKADAAIALLEGTPIEFSIAMLLSTAHKALRAALAKVEAQS